MESKNKMKVKLLALFMLSFLAVAAFSAPNALAATTWTVCAPSGCNYTTIQAAISAATTLSGDTIAVGAGTYSGNIIVTKSLTILGDPGDALPGPGASAPVIDGNALPGDAFKIANGVTDVTIQGFEMRNFTSPLMNGIGNGISAWVGSTARITVVDNYFHHLGYNGVLVGNDYNINPAKWGDHSNWLIKNNVIENFGYIGFELTNTSNSSIEDNVIHMMTPYIGAIFSSARRSETGLTIKNNLIDGTPSTAFPVIYIYAYDNDMPNPNLNNVLIEGNTIASVGTPFQIYIRNISTGTVTNVEVHYNSLSTLKNLTSAQINATCNWWGYVSGPAIGAVFGDVIYDPWLLAPDGPCQGGQPVAVNTTLSPSAVAVTSIGSITVTALIDDTFTGGSDIVSAQFSVNGGTWYPMTASDGLFDSASESVTAQFTLAAVGISQPGVYSVCVRGTDAGGLISNEDCAFLAVYDPNGGFVTGGGWINSPAGALNQVSNNPIYDSIPQPLPGNVVSLGYEATSTSELGDHIRFSSAGQSLNSVVATMSSWACESGNWYDGTCLTTQGATFSHPITLNIYNVVYTNGVPGVGSLIASKTQSFSIPYRPSTDPQCTAIGKTGWGYPTCFNGIAANIAFDFMGSGITLPAEVIYGMVYNTSHYGPSPIGVSGPYDSLNFGLVTKSPTVGTDAEPGTLFWNTSYGPFYCDGGAGGVGIFRRDAGCWTETGDETGLPYTPAVKFNTDKGRANFGFVSKYQKGATLPTGKTEFQFQAGNLNFHSTTYDWLVVNKNSMRAQYKGSGTVNGGMAPNGQLYRFILWAYDGTPSGNFDTFRIKIWWEDSAGEHVVYDNGFAGSGFETGQPISGGSIVVHAK